MSALAQKQLTESDPKARFRNAPRKPGLHHRSRLGRYTPAEHNRWDRLFKRSQAILRNRACDEFVAMIKSSSFPDPAFPTWRS